MKQYIDDLPLSLVVADEINPSEYTRGLLDGKKANGRKLLCGHFDDKEYGVHIKLLQFYISVGCKVEKVHDVIKFAQRPYFKSYIEKCMHLRELYRDDANMSYMFKTMGNSLYGKTIMNCRKYNTTTSLVRARNWSKHLSDPFFRKVELVTKNFFFCY